MQEKSSKGTENHGVVCMAVNVSILKNNDCANAVKYVLYCSEKGLYSFTFQLSTHLNSSTNFHCLLIWGVKC